MGYDGHEAGCSCRSCSGIRAAHRIATRRRRERKRAGTAPSITDVRAHIARLLTAGWTRRGIAAAAGVSQDTIDRLAGGKGQYVVHATGNAILAVEVPSPASRESGRIPAAGTRRRIQALAAIGHPLYVVAERAGLEYRHASTIARGKQARTSVRVARAVAAVYDDLWATPGPSARARAYAARRGWVSPLAWDDDVIDDPAAQPLLGEKDPSRLVTIAEDADELERAGEGSGAIEAKLGVTWDRIQASRRARREAEAAA